MKFFTKSYLLQVSKHMIILCLIISTISCEDDDIEEPNLPALTIASIEPTTARVGDTLTITGTGFEHEYPSQNILRFSDGNSGVEVPPTIVIESETTATALKVVIPPNAQSGPISITVYGVTMSSEQRFTLDTSLPAPVINSITPEETFPNTVVTVQGNNFVDGLETPILYLNEQAITPDQSTLETITFTIPGDAPIGEGNIRVERGGLTSSIASIIISSLPVAVRGTYWTASSFTTGNSINAGIIDENGVTINTLYDDTDGVNDPRGIVIDNENNLVFWVNQNPNTFALEVLSAPLDGSGTVETLYEDTSFSVFNMDLVYDQEHQLLYLLEEGLDPITFESNLSLSRKNITDSSSNFEPLLELPQYNTGFMKIDVSNQRYYIAAFNASYNGTILSGNLSGGDPEILYENLNFLAVKNLAIHPDQNKIYYLLSDDFSTYQIYEMQLDSRVTEILVEGEADLVGAADLELDIENNFLFWMNTPYDSEGSIKRINLETQEVEILFSGITEGRFFTLDIQ